MISASVVSSPPAETAADVPEHGQDRPGREHGHQRGGSQDHGADRRLAAGQDAQRHRGHLGRGDPDRLHARAQHRIGDELAGRPGQRGQHRGAGHQDDEQPPPRGPHRRQVGQPQRQAGREDQDGERDVDAVVRGHRPPGPGRATPAVAATMTSGSRYRSSPSAAAASPRPRHGTARPASSPLTAHPSPVRPVSSAGRRGHSVQVSPGPPGPRRGPPPRTGRSARGARRAAGRPGGPPLTPPAPIVASGPCSSPGSSPEAAPWSRPWPSPRRFPSPSSLPRTRHRRRPASSTTPRPCRTRCSSTRRSARGSSRRTTRWTGAATPTSPTARTTAST